MKHALCLTDGRDNDGGKQRGRGRLERRVEGKRPTKRKLGILAGKGSRENKRRVVDKVLIR